MWQWVDDKVDALDFEASGTLPEYALQPWRMDRGQMWATSLSVVGYEATPKPALVASFSQIYPKPAQVAEVLVRSIREKRMIVGWNIAYDVAIMLAMGLHELVFEAQFLDGMLLWRHLEVEPEYEFQQQRHLKRKWRLKPEAVQQWIPTFAGLDEDVDFHATDHESMRKLQLYNDRDGVRTWTIAKMIWHKLSPRQQAAALIEAECIPMVAEANVNGLQIDYLAAKHLGAKLDLDAAARLHELAPHGMTEKIVRSPKQLGNLMFGDPEWPNEPHWGLPVLKENKSKTTGNTTRSTDKEVLHELSFIDERAKGVKAYREALNAKAKFSDAIIKAVDYNGDGRAHPITNIAATYTHRMTVSSKQGKGKDERQIGFALHQMKREAEFREPVIAPPGYTLVEFDAAGQEFRWMAVASGDQTMLHLCMPGEDPHSYMGAQIVNEDYHDLVRRFKAEESSAKHNRYLGKFANLSLQYRTSARKLRSKARVDYDIPMELPEAQRIHATYQRTYPGVPRYWEEQIAIVRSLGYVETFAGTRVQVVGDWDGKYSWSMGSTAINTRIQGTGADQKYLAMKHLKHPLAAVGGSFSWDLHDGLYLWIPDDKVQATVPRLKYILDNLPYREEWGFTPPVPMPWDCKYGKVWGRMKEWEFDQ